MCAFQVRLTLIVSPSNLAVLTTSTSFPSIISVSSSTGFRANEIRSSLHLSGLSWTLLVTFRGTEKNQGCDLSNLI